MPQPLIRKVDCVQVPVDDLEAGLEFYCERLGHEPVWGTATAAGLRLPDSDVELVLQTERPALEPNFLVPSVEEAARDFVAAGGELVAGPFDIQIGRCAVVRDPWRNHLVLLDMSNGRLVTDAEGNVSGNETV
jgi:predicted enzyme related to lactoylglutathione lyase